jgi:hypothetical protein
MNKTVTVKYRLTPDEKETRDRVSEILMLSESQIDRDLWQAESERIKDGRERLAAPDSVPDSGGGKHPALAGDNGRLRVYTIPMWDEKGNAQVFIEHPDGEWLDVQEERMVSEDYVLKYVAGYERAILSYL